MKKREIVVLIGVVIVLTSISLFTPLGYYPGLSISMATTSWGPGINWLNVDGNGNVSYEFRLGSTIQPGSAKITPQQVKDVVAAIMKANVWALKDSYGHSIFDPICKGCQTVDLSITFNGRSKHISYYDDICTANSMGGVPPPQALCDLQHKIEAIGHLAFPQAIPAPRAAPPPRPRPTATPVPPPTPALPRTTPPPFMRAGDFGILSQEPCGPPCFLGIRPGVTTFDEAALILKNAGAPCAAITPGKSLFCQSGDTSIGVATSGPCTADNGGLMVAEIGLRPPDKITLGGFIAKYGPPDLLMIDPGGSLAMFSHDSLQALVSLPPQLSQQPPYALTPDIIITYFDYVTAAEYPKCVQMMGNKLQPWKGYGAYTPKMNP